PKRLARYFIAARCLSLTSHPQHETSRATFDLTSVFPALQPREGTGPGLPCPIRPPVERPEKFLIRQPRPRGASFQTASGAHFDRRRRISAHARPEEKDTPFDIVFRTSPCRADS